MTAHIRINQLSKSYEEGNRRHQVLEAVDLEIQSGETVVLLGKSGSGKSTLLNLISGIDLPDSGDIYIQSQNLAILGEEERTLFRRRDIGFIFQFFNLIPTLSVEENLLLPLELNACDDAEAKQRAAALLEEVGLGDRADSFPDRLSGGEQQRVAIARALIHQPAIILADEPTGNLDEETGKTIIALMNRLVKQEKRTMIIATHSREIIGLADRVYTLRQRRFVEVTAEMVNE